MLKLQSRFFSSSIVRTASQKGKSSSFSRKSADYKPTKRRITANTHYKNWSNTVHTARLNSTAPSISLPTFSAANLKDENVTLFSGSQMKSLRHLGSFKKNQFNELFRQPVSLIRKDATEELAQLLKETPKGKFIITGEPGVGKSTLLTQMQALAVDSNQIIVNISYPELFLNGRNDFMFDEKLGLYTQPMYLKKLIRKILKANNPELLKAIKLSKNYKFSKTTLKGTQSLVFHQGTQSLYDLLASSTNANLRGEHFQAIIDELYNQKDIPVCFTVDNFSRLLNYPLSAYRDTNNEPIHVLDLQLGRIIMDIVGGAIPLNNNKSHVLLAVSGVDKTNRTLPVALGKLPEDKYISQYHYEPRFAEILKKGQVREFTVAKLSKDEVRKLIEFYLEAGIVLGREANGKTLEQLTDEKYFISGNGNPRELLKSLVLTHR